MEAAFLLESTDELGHSVGVGGLLGELDDVEYALDAEREALLLEFAREKVHVLLGKALELIEHVDDLGAARHIRHVYDLAEGVIEAELFDELLLAGGRYEQQLAALGRQLLEEQLDRLQDEIGEARSNRCIVEHRLDVVHDHAAELGLVGVVEYLVDGLALGQLAEADHGLGRAELEERKIAVHGDLGRQRRLAAVRSTLEQYGDEWRHLALDRLIDAQLALLEHLLDLRTPQQDAVAYVELEVLGAHAELGLDVVGQRVHEVVTVDLELVDGVRVQLHLARGLDRPIHGARLGGAHQALELGAAEVLGERGELLEVHVGVHLVVLAHLGRVYLQYVHATELVGQADLELHLETTRTQQRLVDHVASIRHADDQYVVELIHAVDFRQQLIDHRVAHSRRASLQNAWKSK